jgi:aminoglycoside 6'-N-acetyltransferase I
MRLALWPDSDPDQESKEIIDFLADPSRPLQALETAFVCQRSAGGLCGLVEISIHQSAPGCKTDRIAYIEAWYVDADKRSQGIGRALMERAEAWAKAKGCPEMASDTTPSYPLSPAAHIALGFEAVERYYRQDLS